MEALRPLLSLAVVFSLLGLTLWILRGKRSLVSRLFQKNSRARSLDASERLVLTPQHALHLVRVGDRELLVATHPQGCSVLTPPAQGSHP